jgi:hypothetical protein
MGKHRISVRNLAGRGWQQQMLMLLIDRLPSGIGLSKDNGLDKIPIYQNIVLRPMIVYYQNTTITGWTP